MPFLLWYREVRNVPSLDIFLTETFIKTVAIKSRRKSFSGHWSHSACNHQKCAMSTVEKKRNHFLKKLCLYTCACQHWWYWGAKNANTLGIISTGRPSVPTHNHPKSSKQRSQRHLVTITLPEALPMLMFFNTLLTKGKYWLSSLLLKKSVYHHLASPGLTHAEYCVLFMSTQWAKVLSGV